MNAIYRLAQQRRRPEQRRAGATDLGDEIVVEKTRTGTVRRHGEVVGLHHPDGTRSALTSHLFSIAIVMSSTTTPT